MAFLAFLVSCLVKKGKQEQDSKTFMTFKNKEKNAKKRKMSDLEKMDKDRDEDIQRSIMIRKSLASRTSTVTTMENSNETELQEDDDNDTDPENSDQDSDGPNPDSLKNDWKAYEAGLQRNRSVLIQRHPGIDRSAGSSSHAPSSSMSITPPTTMPLSSASSSRTHPLPRQYTFPTITRKPVPSTTDNLDGPAVQSIGRAVTQG